MLVLHEPLENMSYTTPAADFVVTDNGIPGRGQCRPAVAAVAPIELHTQDRLQTTLCATFKGHCYGPKTTTSIELGPNHEVLPRKFSSNDTLSNYVRI